MGSPLLKGPHKWFSMDFSSGIYRLYLPLRILEQDIQFSLHLKLASVRPETDAEYYFELLLIERAVDFSHVLGNRVLF